MVLFLVTAVNNEIPAISVNNFISVFFTLKALKT